MITFLRWILLPFSLFYQFIIWIRNLLYDKEIIKSQSFSIPTIVIGNLAIGGTGKSPMTEYLVRLLKDRYKVSTLSRGYGRKTKGFRFVDTTSKAIEVGDEPLQFKRKFPGITVAVSEDRCKAVQVLKATHEIIILDDAYQHRKLKAGLSILLFDYSSLFKPIFTLPTGDFRDIFSSTKRANLIIITKCPDEIPNHKKAHIEHIIRKHSISPIFYTRIGYDRPRNLHQEQYTGDLSNLEIVLFCGIANPDPLVNYLLAKGNNVHLIKFTDHHNYSSADFEKVLKQYYSISGNNKLILTTEKDLQRVDKSMFAEVPFFYIPIHLRMAEDQQVTFDHFIENYISRFSKIG